MNCGLAEMIQHERVPIMGRTQLDCAIELGPEHQHFVDFPRGLDLRNATFETWIANNAANVRFVLQLMSIATQFREAVPAGHSPRDIVSTQIDPADDTGDPVVIARDLQEEISLGLVCTRLHGDARVDPAIEQQRLEMLRQVIPLQHLHAIRHPGIVFAPVAPEVLVRVDFHVASTTRCCCSPRPLMPRRIVFPARRKIGAGFCPMPTPAGVPVEMTSPDCRLITRLT